MKNKDYIKPIVKLNLKIEGPNPECGNPLNPNENLQRSIWFRFVRFWTFVVAKNHLLGRDIRSLNQSELECLMPLLEKIPERADELCLFGVYKFADFYKKEV